jgi:hypothetical protein
MRVLERRLRRLEVGLLPPGSAVSPTALAFSLDSAHRKQNPSISGDRSICTSRWPASVSAALPVRGACIQDTACTPCAQVPDHEQSSSRIGRAWISRGRASCVLLQDYRFALIL